MEKKTLLVLGIDEFNKHELTQIEDYDTYDFIYLFEPRQVRKQKDINVEELTHAVDKTIKSQQDNLDGIITFFDFPFTLLTFLFLDKYKFKGPTLLAGLKCEHKYWSRVEQNKVVPEHIPKFDAINPKDPKGFYELSVDSPFWLKPVKSHSSRLGFKIRNEQEYEQALNVINQEISYFAKPFNRFFTRTNTPSDIEAVDGYYCVAENIISGHQCTLSGYVYNNEVVTYGIVDSLYYDAFSSFLCYLLPGDLPQDVQAQMHDIASRVMKHIEYNNSPFNIEFFFREDTGEIKILEINPRMSQSHGYLYNMVKGYSNHQVLVKLAVGEKPSFRQKKGKYQYAAKFQYRIPHDGIVQEVPDASSIAAIEHDFEDSTILLSISEGDRLSDLKINDPYSYCIGEVMVAAQNREQLFEKYETIKQKLKIKIGEPD